MSDLYDDVFYAEQRDGSLRSAEVMLPFVIELTGATSLVDVGCGVGGWLSVARAHGVERVRGFDGDYVNRAWLRIPQDDFQARDLTQPISSDETFDLAMSLEVAEHLPASRAASFVADLCALAPVVFFSAAQPHQGGTDHINEQYLDFWVPLFEKQGFELIDCCRPRFWDEAGIEYYYGQNGVIFARPGHLPDEVRGPRMPLRAVHPGLVAFVTSPPLWVRPWLQSSKQLLGAVPAIVRRVANEKLKK